MWSFRLQLHLPQEFFLVQPFIFLALISNFNGINILDLNHSFKMWLPI